MYLCVVVNTETKKDKFNFKERRYLNKIDHINFKNYYSL